MRVRREVLGDRHVDSSIARTTDLTRDYQEFITRTAWGDVWSRPGLDRKTRSCITLTALVALGRDNELALHVRAAIRNGLTQRRDRRGAAPVRRVLRRARREQRVRGRTARAGRVRRLVVSREVLRTQVGIVGAGPAGLMLARLLHLQGIESVVLENRSRSYVEQRIRAGVLEQPTVDLLQRAGVGDRMRREGIVHHGIELQFDGERHRIPLSDLTEGRSIVIYGQTEVVKDLIASRLDDGLPLHFEVEDVSVHELESERPRIRYRQERRGARARVRRDRRL